MMRILRVVFYCLLGGLSLTPAALGTGGFSWCWLAGTILSASFVPVALFGPRRAISQFGVIAPVLLIVTVLCLWSEALIFVQVPEVQQHAVRDLVGASVIYVILAAVLAILAVLLKLPRVDRAKVQLHSPGKVALLVVVCGMAYVLYYLVFGAITYQFFTKGYYPDAPQLVARLGIWFWLIQLGRGVLMTLAALPLVRSLRMSRMQAAIAVGMILWVAGGAAPLLLPNPLMLPAQRIIHTIEILTQNVSLGITMVLLLRPKQARSGADLPVAAHSPG
ncbi:MAG TPA: hypothetical protein VFI38_06795 [Candidatus Acidoferrum sp.]|nr:hypothetical protein [Candidatus Acidoferrum sp.]